MLRKLNQECPELGQICWNGSQSLFVATRFICPKELTHLILHTSYIELNFFKEKRLLLSARDGSERRISAALAEDMVHCQHQCYSCNQYQLKISYRRGSGVLFLASLDTACIWNTYVQAGKTLIDINNLLKIIKIFSKISHTRNYLQRK